MPTIPPAVSARPGTRTRLRRVGDALGRPEVAAAVAVAVVFGLLGLVRLLSSWPVIGDWAVAELVVRHVGRHVPLSGPYSAQRGFDHPLPFVYALQWVPYVLTGGRAASAPAAALWFDGALLAALVLVLRRRALGLALVTLAGVAVFAGTRDDAVLLVPWNPNLAVVPSLVLVFVAWRVACGSARLLPVAVALGVWSIGAHAGFAPLVLVTLAGGVAGLVAGRVRRDGRAEAARTLRRPLALAVVVGLVLLSPMLVDLARDGGDSNPVRLVQGLDGDGRPTVARTESVRVLAAELSFPPAWSQRSMPYSFYLRVPPYRLPVLVPVALAAAVLAWRRRAFEEVAGIGLAGAGVLAAAAGLLRIQDELFQPWYLHPIHVAALAFAAFTLWSGCRSVAALAAARWSVPDRWREGSSRRPSGSVAAAGVALVLALAVVPSLHPIGFHRHVEDDVAVLAAAVEDRYEPGRRLLVDGPVDLDGYYSATLTLLLDRAGYDVRVPPSDGYIFTDALVRPPGWRGTTLRLTFSVEPPTTAPPGETIVATVRLHPDTPLPDAPNLTVYEVPAG